MALESEQYNTVDVLASLQNEPRQLMAEYEIDDRVYKVIIDTGASISIIPEFGQIFRRIDRTKIKSASVEVVLADEGVKSIDLMAEVLYKPYPSNQSPLVTSFHVIRGKSHVLGYEALIGLNLMRSFNMDIKLREGKALVYHEGKLIGQEILARDVYQAYVKLEKEIGHSNDPDLDNIIKTYRDVFSDISEQPIRGQPMRIYTQHLRPIHAKMRHYNEEEVIQMKEHIQGLLDKGYIMPSNSGYSSTSRIIPKKNGTGRLVINYIPLNKVTIRDSFPMPHITDILAAIQGKKYFTTMDCTQGFYQILIDQRDRQKTAFSTPIGLFEFIRCPFGARNSGAYFQSEMSRIFFDGLYTKCVVYVDDILIFGNTREEHDTNLAWVLSRCQEFYVKIKFEKCQFAVYEVEYLGFLVSGNSIKPIQDKIDALVIIQPPKDKTDLKSIMGKLNFYSRFIENYSHNFEPLRELLCQSREFVWKDIHQKAHDKLIELLRKATSHYLVDRNVYKHISLYAVDDSFEAILTTEDGLLIHRTSRLASNAERNYSLIEKHLVALVMAMNKFKIWLHPNKFKVIVPIRGMDKIFKLVNKPERVDIQILRLPTGFDNYVFEVQNEIQDLEPTKTKRKLNHIPQETFYIDGSVIHNGKSDCVAAWAICCKHDQDLELTGLVANNPSNQTAEVYAAVKACEVAKQKGLNDIEIVTDSAYLYNAVTKDIDRWSRNNWLSTKKQLVKNKELFEELVKAKKGLEIEWKKVKGHSTCQGNIRADRLARDGLFKTLVPIAPIVSRSKQKNQEDLETSTLKERIETENLPDYKIRDGSIYFIDKNLPKDSNERLYVPASNRLNLLKLAHDDQVLGGHLGIKKTYRKLIGFWWPGMNKMVEDYVKTCDLCQDFKESPGVPKGYLHSIPVTKFFQHLHIDCVGPLYPPSSRGNKYIITATDAYSKYAYAIAVPNTLTRDIIKFVEDRIFAIHGIPEAIITDNGCQFTSKEWRSFKDKYGFHHKFTTTYHPQSNGIDERVNGTITRMLRHYVNDTHSNWDDKLKWTMYCYNTTCHDSTHYSPFQLLYGLDSKSPLNPNVSDHISQDVVDNCRNRIREEAKINNVKAQDKQKFNYDRNRKECDYKIGQWVQIRNHTNPTDKIRKFYPKWSEPVMICDIVGDKDNIKAVIVIDLYNQEKKTVAIQHIKPYNIRKNNNPIADRINAFEKMRKLEERDNYVDSTMITDHDTDVEQTNEDDTLIEKGTSQNYSLDESPIERNDPLSSFVIRSHFNEMPYSSTPRHVTINDDIIVEEFDQESRIETVDSITMDMSNQDERSPLARPIDKDRQVDYYEPDFVELNPSHDPTIIIPRLSQVPASTRVLRPRNLDQVKNINDRNVVQGNSTSSQIDNHDFIANHPVLHTDKIEKIVEQNSWDQHNLDETYIIDTNESNQSTQNYNDILDTTYTVNRDGQS